MVRDVRLDGTRSNDMLGASPSPIPEGGLDKGRATHSVHGYFVREAGKAVIVNVKDMRAGVHRNCLLPTSQVFIKKHGGMDIEVYMQGWLYKEKFR